MKNGVPKQRAPRQNITCIELVSTLLFNKIAVQQNRTGEKTNVEVVCPGFYIVSNKFLPSYGKNANLTMALAVNATLNLSITVKVKQKRNFPNPKSIRQKEETGGIEKGKKIDGKILHCNILNTSLFSILSPSVSFSQII